MNNDTPAIADHLIGKYCIVRTYSAGVFAGTLARMDGQQAVVSGARRLWHWDGAASLSELAVLGTAKPESCKFPVQVSEVLLLQVIEVLPCTEAAKESITSVQEWAV